MNQLTNDVDALTEAIALIIAAESAEQACNVAIYIHALATVMSQAEITEALNAAPQRLHDIEQEIAAELLAKEQA